MTAVASALLFGVSAPVIARFGNGESPFTTAALLYAGAFASTLPWLTRTVPADAQIARRDVARIALVALLGAALAPTLFAWGIARSGAVTGSLLLNTEAAFTVVFAYIFYREPITKQMLLALVLMTLGGIALAAASAQHAATSAPHYAGVIAVAGATLAWALDNTLTRPLANQDATRVVAMKSAFGALLTLTASRVLHEPLPQTPSLLALAACGALSYGLSLRLYLHAQRSLGAARTASIFALAPFIGALLAVMLGDSTPGALTWLAAPLFAAGVVLHLRERHDHWHTHEAAEHVHAHRHDDGHHDHAHSPAVVGEHVHAHRHVRLEHQHEHGLDHDHDHHGKARS